MKWIGKVMAVGTLGVAMLGSTAFAADWDDYRGRAYYNVQWGYNGGADYAYQNGMHDGGHSGYEDAVKGYPFRATDHGQFRGATDGYHGGMPKDMYRQAYREGYMRGYRQAYAQASRGYGYGYRNWR